METTEITLENRDRHVVDLTGEAAAFCRPLGDGLLSVFAPHPSAGSSPATTATATATAAPATAPTTSCRCSSARRSRSPSSAAGWRWAPGRASCWSTSTATTRSAGSACPSCPPEGGLVGFGPLKRVWLLLGVVATSLVGFVPPAHAVRAAACVLAGTITFTEPFGTTGPGTWETTPRQL